RALLLARSGLAVFTANARALDHEVKLGNLSASTYLTDQWPDTEILGGCRIGFRPGLPYRSTDNSFSDMAAAGYLDRGTSNRSVPPYTVELILRTEIEGVVRLHRALVRRAWPYAAYVGSGPLVLCGTPDGSSPTVVRGRVYCGYDGGGILFGAVSDPDLDGARLWVARRELQGSVVVRVPAAVSVGPKLDYIPGFQPYSSLPGAPPAPSLAGEAPRWFEVGGIQPDSSRPPNADRDVGVENPGNVLAGSVDLQTALQLWSDANVDVRPGNTYTGSTVYRYTLEDPLDRLDPSPPDGSIAVTGLPRVLEEGQDPAGRPTYVLSRTVKFSAESNPLGGPAGTRYVVDGNLVSRLMWSGPSRDSLRVESYPASLELENCTLHVKGDLDLWRPLPGGPGFESYPETVMRGSNATLVVEGSLMLGGARLDSKDRGMVLYARHLVMRTSGEFKGLIVARRSVSMLPDGDGRLRMRGGIVCGGYPGAEGIPGIVMRSVDLTYDPRYLKLLHELGQFRVTGFDSL
ncbi:MAG: hypothetical protein AB1758_31820, partial [Candidatus Eremiobacterota bacterium]